MPETLYVTIQFRGYLAFIKDKRNRLKLLTQIFEKIASPEISLLTDTIDAYSNTIEAHVSQAQIENLERQGFRVDEIRDFQLTR